MMDDVVQIYCQRLNESAHFPTKSHVGDAGWDLYTSVGDMVEPGAHVNISTHIAIALPVTHFGHLLPRSSTLLVHGLAVTPAVIDSGYRGELFVQATNLGKERVFIAAGMRIAQLLILPVPNIKWIGVDALPHSARGLHGFGSTGR